MSFRFPLAARKVSASLKFLHPYFAIPILLSSLALLDACGNPSRPDTSDAAPNPAASLTVTSSLPAASVGSTYNATLTVSGGTAPYRFSLASGQLPGGINLNDSTGILSGTPSSGGNFGFTLSVSDSSGDSKQQPLQIAVANPPSNGNGGGGNGGSGGGSSGGNSNQTSASAGTPFPNLQKAAGWGQFGQGEPNFVDCSPSPCDGITFSMNQGVNSPSLSGSATEFNLGGTTPYSDGLWNNHMIGPLSSQGTFDTNGTLVPTLHNFTYDVYFYGDNFGAAQALEFDMNQFFGGMAFIFGHECRIASGNEWDVWDAQNARWTPTGVPCYPNNNSWNHLTLQVQRNSNNQLVYQSITLNGQSANLNWTFSPGSAPNWYGVTINYQMDGNAQQAPYSVYLDNLTFTFQ